MKNNVIHRQSRYLLGALLLLLAAPINALPIESAVPGGIVLLPLGPASDTTSVPEAHYQGRRVAVIEHEHQWQALVGIALDAKLGEHSISAQHEDGRKSQSRFVVGEKNYPEQRIRLKDNSKVELSKAALDRVGEEQATINGYKKHFRETPFTPLDFTHPTNGPLSSRFGLKRYFNDKPRKPHSGLDYAAPAGTPVTAPAAGKVLGTGDFFFNGNSVFLDHGQGLISMFGHLSRIDVKVGQWLDQGELLGAVGNTGRSTAAHLHWTILLNGNAVDPELFLPAVTTP